MNRAYAAPYAPQAPRPSLDDAVRLLYQQQVPFIEVRSEDGAPMAYVVRPEMLPGEVLSAARASADPKALPRAARPKRRLSKRQRDAAKAEKLRPAVPAA